MNFSERGIVICVSDDFYCAVADLEVDLGVLRITKGWYILGWWSGKNF